MELPDKVKKGLECCVKYNCAECPYYPLHLLSNCKTAIARDALALVQQLEARVPRWISVKERLPEAGQIVLFIPTCNSKSVYVGTLSHVGKQGGVMFENRYARTTMKYYARDWMPLPEPPKEDIIP